MSPRIVAAKRCPHCKAKLSEPTPRVCPECAGSLQKRFLSLGCFSTAPPIVLAMLGAAWLYPTGSQARATEELSRPRDGIAADESPARAFSTPRQRTMGDRAHAESLPPR